jgi:hypothetical protein
VASRWDVSATRFIARDLGPQSWSRCWRSRPPVQVATAVGRSSAAPSPATRPQPGSPNNSARRSRSSPQPATSSMTGTRATLVHLVHRHGRMRSHHGRKRAHLPAQPSGSSSVSARLGPFASVCDDSRREFDSRRPHHSTPPSGGVFVFTVPRPEPRSSTGVARAAPASGLRWRHAEGGLPRPGEPARYCLECTLSKLHGARFGPDDYIEDKAVAIRWSAIAVGSRSRAR